MGQGVAGKVAANRVPTILNGEAHKNPGFEEVGSSAVPRSRWESTIVYPLFASGTLVGMLTFNRLAQGALYIPRDLERASVLASQVLLALENVQLEKQAATAEKLGSHRTPLGRGRPRN